MRKNSIGFRISNVVLSLLMFIVLSGFIPLAIVAYKKGKKFNTAKVQVQAAADELYSTALGIINDDTALELQKKDDKNMKAEARKGELVAKIQVTQLDNGKAELIVEADAGKKEADKELALHIVERICGAMGVPYKVDEK